MQDMRTSRARTRRCCRRKLQLGAGWPPLTRPPPRQPVPSSLPSQSGRHTHPREGIRTAASPQNKPDTQHRQRDKPQHVPHQGTEVNPHTRHMEPQVTAGDKPEHTLSTSRARATDAERAPTAGPGWKARWPHWEPRAQSGCICHGKYVSITLVFKRPQIVTHSMKQESMSSDSHK